MKRNVLCKTKCRNPDNPKKEKIIIIPKLINCPKKQHLKPEQKFQFTRHLLSCNNISAGKDSILNKDFEPGPTIYGISKTINYTRRQDQQKYFKSEHIFVSNLYRTWITAFLLYATHIDVSRTLHLYVSPYLKEFHKTILGFNIKRGNFPKPINHIASKFLFFLDRLHEICTYPDKKLSKLFYKRQLWYTKLPSSVKIYLPPKDGKIQEIQYTKTDKKSKYKLIKFCNISDTSGPRSGREFTNVGDLHKFMKWYNSENNYYKRYGKNPRYIHVVTHSHIMRSYLSRFNINTGEPFNLDVLQKRDLNLSSIRNSNTWHFRTSQNKKLRYKTIKGLIRDFDIVPGVSSINNAKDLEKIYLEYSLCGKKGSVIPINKNC